jgi:hypothetical protein
MVQVRSHVVLRSAVQTVSLAPVPASGSSGDVVSAQPATRSTSQIPAHAAGGMVRLSSRT